MDKFTLIEVFMKFLKRADYHNKEAFSQDSFDKTLEILEKDSVHIFQIMYGEKLIKNRGTKKISEATYRWGEANRDVKMRYIKNTMHYLLTQIKIGTLKL